jgi:putative transcriptional regulator
VATKPKEVRTYRSEIAASVHEMMEGVYDAGLIDKQTMREFDASCLSPAPPMAPQEIRAIV